MVWTVCNVKEHSTSSVSLPATHAVGGSDFTADPTTMLTFYSGNTNRTVSVMAEDDSVIENNETFTLSLTSNDDAVDMTPQSATVTIIDQTSKYIHCHINRME